MGVVFSGPNSCKRIFELLLELLLVDQIFHFDFFVDLFKRVLKLCLQPLRLLDRQRYVVSNIIDLVDLFSDSNGEFFVQVEHGSVLLLLGVRTHILDIGFFFGKES